MGRILAEPDDNVPLVYEPYAECSLLVRTEMVLSELVNGYVQNFPALGLPRDPEREPVVVRARAVLSELREQQRRRSGARTRRGSH